MKFNLNKCPSCKSDALQPEWGILQEWTRSETGGYQDISISCSNEDCDMEIVLSKPDNRLLKSSVFENACVTAWNKL